MNERRFREVMDTCQEKSGNGLKEYLAQFEDQPTVVSLLTGTEFDDIGLGRKSVRSVAQRVYDFEDDEGDLTTSLAEHCDPVRELLGQSMEQLYMDLEMLDSKSGDDQKDFLEQLFEDYAHPSVVSYAVLSDVSLGFGESTLAKAFGVKDSLPFYESVVQILRVNGEPLTEPQAGKPFRPMLAVPESRGEPDNAVAQRKIDGYRCLIHVGQTLEEFKGDAVADGETPVRAFSRRMNEITESLPELQELGLDELSGHYIIDCEVIAEDGSYASTSERIGRSAENVERQLDMEFACFDIVMYSGVNIHEESFEYRFNNLKQVEHAVDDDRFYAVPVQQDIESAKDHAMANGEEGIIVKNEESPYVFDKRSKHWQKQKLDDERVDVRIVNIEEGTGKLGGTMGKVELESADHISLGSCGSGFTETKRDEIWENQSDWIGRTIEVEARGLGTGSRLRMPIFKRDRSDDGEPDDFDRIREVMQDV